MADATNTFDGFEFHLASDNLNQCVLEVFTGSSRILMIGEFLIRYRISNCQVAPVQGRITIRIDMMSEFYTNF